MRQLFSTGAQNVPIAIGPMALVLQRRLSKVIAGATYQIKSVPITPEQFQEKSGQWFTLFCLVMFSLRI
jgi:hypothetical protein